MVTDRWNYLLLFCILMTVAMSGCEKKKPVEEVKPDLPVQMAEVVSPLAGCWRSVKMEGADIGNFIKEIRYTFGNDGSFAAEVTMADGSTDKKDGTFRIDGNRLFQLVEGASVDGEFELENGKLIIFDPYLDTKVWFEKQI